MYDIQSLIPEFVFLFCLLFGELECKFQLQFLFIRVSGLGLLHILFSLRPSLSELCGEGGEVHVWGGGEMHVWGWRRDACVKE